MRSIADALRTDTRRRLADLTPEDRVRLSLELGKADVAALSEARGLSSADARARIARSRQAGRQPSSCHDA
jgi:hypothetical protein